jgi:hypothetical protein
MLGQFWSGKERLGQCRTGKAWLGLVRSVYNKLFHVTSYYVMAVKFRPGQIRFCQVRLR